MPFSGLLLIEKPADFTSTYVTAYVKKCLRALCNQKIKIGHIGTLDPFATGLLPIALGEGTRLIPWIEKRQKSYIFTLRWGAETTTGDYTGDVLETSAFRPSTQEIEALLPQFHGQITQIPPRFSALKIGGERAYKLARAGIEFTLTPRPQYIAQLELLEASLDEATFRVACNTGTYVRTLGQDIARTLGTYGHLVSLARESVGKWILSQAISLDSLKEIAHDKDKLRAFLIRPRAMLDDIPAIEVEEEEALQLRNGRSLTRDLPSTDVVACVAGGTLVALARIQEKGLYPFRVFNFDN